MRILKVIVKEVGKALLSPAECKIVDVCVTNARVKRLAKKCTGVMRLSVRRKERTINNLLADMIKNRRTELLEPLLAKEVIKKQLVLFFAAFFGQISVIKLTMKYGGYLGPITQAHATLGNQFRITQWLWKQKTLWGSDVMEEFAATGNIEALRWLIQKDAPENKACVGAARNGQLAALKFLVEKKCRVTPEVSEVAADHGDLEILKFLASKQRVLSERMGENAARRGHLHVLKWLKETSRFLPNSSVCWNGVYEGHNEVVKWAYANGCPLTEMVCYTAARSGNLEILKWARAQGCPWNINTCNYARRKRNNAEMLAWLTANGCSCGGTLH